MQSPSYSPFKGYDTNIYENCENSFFKKKNHFKDNLILFRFIYDIQIYIQYNSKVKTATTKCYAFLIGKFFKFLNMN